MEKVILALSTSILIAVITAVITAILTLRRFRSEQWWLRKAEAYKEIFNALFKIQSYAIYRNEKNFHAEALSSKQEQLLLDRAIEGHDELTRASVISIVYLHPDIQETLEQVIPAVRNSRLPDSYCEVENSMATISNCIEDIRKLAKIDLRVVNDSIFKNNN